jgi:hypothetical protein
MSEQLIQLHEIVAEAHGGIDCPELRERFQVVLDWAGRECLRVQDASRAYALGSARMKQIPHGQSTRWERAD